MFVHVYNPETNHTYLLREIGPHEIMNARKFADDIANEHDTEIDESDGYIHNCLGDVAVEFRETKRQTGSCWSLSNFYFKR